MAVTVWKGMDCEFVKGFTLINIVHANCKIRETKLRSGLFNCFQMFHTFEYLPTLQHIQLIEIGWDSGFGACYSLIGFTSWGHTIEHCFILGYYKCIITPFMGQKGTVTCQRQPEPGLCVQCVNHAGLMSPRKSGNGYLRAI